MTDNNQNITCKCNSVLETVENNLNNTDENTQTMSSVYSSNTLTDVLINEDTRDVLPKNTDSIVTTNSVPMCTCCIPNGKSTNSLSDSDSETDRLFILLIDKIPMFYSRDIQRLRKKMWKLARKRQCNMVNNGKGCFVSEVSRNNIHVMESCFFVISYPKIVYNFEIEELVNCSIDSDKSESESESESDNE